MSAVTAQEITLVPMPIRPEWILAGAPVARGKVTLVSADRRQFTGIWECTAGEFEWNFEYDETVHILEGEVRIAQLDGTVTTLRAGDMARFPRGTRTRWTVDRLVRKVFFHYRESPI